MWLLVVIFRLECEEIFQKSMVLANMYKDNINGHELSRETADLKSIITLLILEKEQINLPKLNNAILDIN